MLHLLNVCEFFAYYEKLKCHVSVKQFVQSCNVSTINIHLVQFCVSINTISEIYSMEYNKRIYYN